MISNKLRLLALMLAIGLLSVSCSGEKSGEKSGEQSQSEQNRNASRVTITPVTLISSEAASSTFQDLQGNPIEISNFAGKKVFLNYWATWCAPCIREIPSIARAAKILGEEDFVFLLASDESLEQISGFIEDNSFEGNFIKLNEFFATKGVQGVPSTILYDAEGEEIFTRLGSYEWDSEENIQQLREY